MVGKSDFNENPVVSLVLDCGLRPRACRYYSLHTEGGLMTANQSANKTHKKSELTL